MGILERIPAPARRFARKVLPARLVDEAKDAIIRTFYVKSTISREGAVARFARRTFTRKRPTLYHLDFHVTDHCNLNCKGCEQFSSISKPGFADLDIFTRDIARLAGLFDNIEQVYLMGGEPLLHPQVESFVRVTRKGFPCTRLVLMTNGVLVPRMSEAVWDALRETCAVLLCDLYPIGISVEVINALGVEHGVNVEWVKPTEEFFKVPVDPAASCDAQASFRRCRGLTNCAMLKEGRLFPCGRAAYAHILADRFDVKGIEAVDDDSIALESAQSGDQAIDFLSSAIPWCGHCDFESFEVYEWGRTQRRADEWLKG